MLNANSGFPAKVSEMFGSEFKAVDAAADLKKLNQDFTHQHKTSPLHLLSAIRTKRVLGEDAAACDKEAAGLLAVDGIQFIDAVEILEALRRWRSPEVDGFKKAAQAKFPDVTRLA